MPKIVIQKNNLRYDIALISWILYSVIVGATTIPISATVGNIWYMACLALLVYHLIQIKRIRKSFFSLFCTLGVIVLFVAVANICSYPPLIAWVLLVVGSTNMDRRHIVAVYFKTYVVLCTVIPLLAVCGVISNTVMDTVNMSGIRISYGFSHPNVFAACVLVLIMSWTYLNWKKVRLIHVLVIDGIGCLLLVFTDSLASFICIIFMSILALFERLLDRRGKMEIWYYATVALLVLCPLISYYLMVNFSMDNPRMLAIDLLSTGRVRTMNAFYETYGWRILGQTLNFNYENRSELLFALDNSYAYILMKFGLIVAVMYYVGLGRVVVMSVKSNDNFLIICIMTFILYGCFENYFFKAQFNFTLLFIALSSFQQSEGLRKIYGELSK